MGEFREDIEGAKELEEVWSARDVARNGRIGCYWLGNRLSFSNKVHDV